MYSIYVSPLGELSELET